jgi:putative endonuclease
MRYKVLILTDNNRNALNIKVLDLQETNEEAVINLSHPRLIYQETFDKPELAEARKTELENFTRMQKERVIRRSNPNWVNLNRTSIQKDYQPGVKFNPNVPKLMSLR